MSTWSRLSSLQLNSRALWTKARLLSAHSQATIASVHLKDKELAIRWSDNQISTLPYIYLRDNCQEPESLDQTAKQRVFNPAFTIDLNIKAKQVEMSEGGQQICLTWPDGHRSRFSSSWLAEHVEGMAPETPRLPVERKYWKSDYYESIPRFDFKKLANDDGTLLEFLLQMDSFGLVLVDNMGTDSNQLQKFCKLIAYPKPSVHGRDVLPVEIRSYPSSSTPLHTSLPYYNYAPGVQGLHCIKQFPGNMRFCDGFSIAQKIRETNSTAFKLLSKNPVQFVDSGDDYVDYNIESWHIPVSVSSCGAITAIYFNDNARGSHYASSLNDKLQEWYEAYHLFASLTISPEFLVEFQMDPGQMVVLDNLRVLHGRVGPKSDVSFGHGYLERAYLDWDEIRSRARVIMAKMSEDTAV